MPRMRRLLVALAAGAFLCALAAQGQDAPSLGDAARQARLQKQQKDKDKDAEAGKGAPGKDPQSKDTPPKDVQPKVLAVKDAAAPKIKKIITNDEIPEHLVLTRTKAASQTPVPAYPQNDDAGESPADEWKDQILAQKDTVTDLQNQMTSLNESIRYAGANCVSNCVEWNEHQQAKQQQLEVLKDQLDQQRKHLEELQESARKQGFGSSVYDP